MKLNDIFKRAAQLSGISEDFLEENDLKDLQARALSAVNSVLFDLCSQEEHQSLFESADITPQSADAAVYGTAMFLSLAYGDTDKSSLFSKIYSDKRSSVKASVSAVKDVLPKAGGAI